MRIIILSNIYLTNDQLSFKVQTVQQSELRQLLQIQYCWQRRKRWRIWQTEQRSNWAFDGTHSGPATQSKVLHERDLWTGRSTLGGPHSKVGQGSLYSLYVEILKTYQTADCSLFHYIIWLKNEISTNTFSLMYFITSSVLSYFSIIFILKCAFWNRGNE